MNGKNISFGDEARKLMISGLNKVADAVKTTLGPKGKLVALRRQWGGAPLMTKDGVTVAREITLPDFAEDSGAQLCRQVASKTNEVAGDGTTTATVLAQGMVNEGLRFIDNGGNNVGIKRGMDKAIGLALDYLENSKVTITLDDIDQLRCIASISANDEEIGKLVADAYSKAGKNGYVSFEPHRGRESTIEMNDGYVIDRGMCSPFFITDPSKTTIEFENPLILVWEQDITGAMEMANFLNNVADGSKKPILVISDDVAGEALATLVINNQRGYPLMAIRSPMSKGMDMKKFLLQDIATITGARFYSRESGAKLEHVVKSNLGTAKKVIISKDETTIIGGGGDIGQLEAYVAGLRKEAEESDIDTKNKIEDRIGKITNGIAVIKFGGSTDSELIEKRFRIEDAVNATKAALDSGIVCGGGIALIGASQHLSNQKIEFDSEEERIGYKIVKNALELPMRIIAENAGVSGDIVIEKCNTGLGYDAAKNIYVEDVVKHGIVDPVKVTKSALENAGSIASLILSTNCLITDLPDEPK